MACKKCSKYPVRRNMCNKCFVEWFEKSSRKEIRESGFKKNEKVHLIDTEDINYSVLRHIFEQVIKLPLTFTEDGKKIFPSSMDSEARDLLERFFKERKANTKSIHLLKNFEQDDIEYYAELKRINGRKKTYSDDTSILIKALDKNFKNIKTSLSKAQQSLKDL